MIVRRNSDLEMHLPDAAQAAPSTAANEADVDMSSDDLNTVSALPAKLAARFYQKSNGRRRASATSSRRSSISSLHSNISAHGGPHSDHVAQHLRRASIIESRKARLADRAAHAEKVRLRAALAKNESKHILREERALAAQQAREKLLAEITAKCEEEVRRAKKKAEDMKERKAAEHARQRLEMAEKFAEAEKRRLLYQQNTRRPRTTSLAAAEEKKLAKVAVKQLSRTSATRIIQRAWRNHYARTVVREFREVDLSLERIRALSFEEVGALLSEEKLLTVTAKVLRLCGLQDTEGGAMGERGAVRTFLSSYLILAHPAQVLSSNGEQEQDLIAKGRDLLVIFEQVISQLSAIGVWPASLTTDLQALSESYNTFFSAFHAWKTHDSSVLIEIMLAQFIELELIWQTVKDDREGGAADDYQKGIRQNQILLLARLKRLAGAEKAMSMVKQALRKSKRDKLKNGASQQSIPRATSVPPSAELLPEPAKSPICESFSTADHLALAQLDQQEMTPRDRFAKALTALPDNRALVHELLINREYKIDQGPYTAIRLQIMNLMCEMMRKDIAKGLGTTWTVAMASVIQDRLLRSLRPGNSLHVLISEVLDPKYVENQCNAGTFSYDAFFEFMSNILPKLCAPYRDPEVKAFASDTSGDAIDRLARLMGIIDLLSLDHTNFLLHVAAPQLIQEGPGYEQRVFSRLLQEGVITLERTREFWRVNRNTIIEDMKKRDPDNMNLDYKPPAAKIYAQGIVDLVLSNRRLSPELIPETLDMDRGHLEQIRSRAFMIAATASILLSAKNLLKRDVRSQWKSEAERIMTLDFNDIKPERVQSILESSHAMPASTRAQLFSTIKRVLSPATAASITATATAAATNSSAISISPDTVALLSSSHSSPSSSSSPFSGSDTGNNTNATNVDCFTDPVTKLMLSRLRAHVLARLSASSASERVRTTATASQSLAAAGMPEFVNEVGKIVESLGKVREVDWLCHGMVYEEVWGEREEDRESRQG
ncbi:conserved hypothetical protein [Histoplasma capsulatum G186AR]|uniref:IQ calmodulin-binding domain-containing protein domain-containing protein n=2 Tax=Ajellomyces capsulatus TaxID=5037 RepID=C0NQP8_AJECG|nr:uncharacterized protein HCBG_05328 [Histoplasma capsulatum G186AR]EEH06012.1 conserved hypothetical protein [Histoplasma capsulatum G186AR]KAG5293526.1 IQ calmodulin-binding motif domain-containing protein [Histoplasma capsulatum]QSS74977.1 IQ calmodulin-binding motif domain-containing protein [Histoplasma capsulatum G186AR]